MPEYTPSAADVRKVRPFDMTDAELLEYVTSAGVSPFHPETHISIPDEARKTMWALLAAHLATVMREPEPTSASPGPVTISWAYATTEEGLTHSAPGREFRQRWIGYNQTGAARVLR